jgi:hypothetical protein
VIGSGACDRGPLQLSVLGPSRSRLPRSQTSCYGSSTRRTAPNGQWLPIASLADAVESPPHSPEYTDCFAIRQKELSQLRASRIASAPHILHYPAVARALRVPTSLLLNTMVQMAESSMCRAGESRMFCRALPHIVVLKVNSCAMIYLSLVWCGTQKILASLNAEGFVNCSATPSSYRGRRRMLSYSIASRR